ncbi:MAG: 3-oxoacid CoA-transferase subunit A [Chloroflexi bacterium]|nr:3-oxoacid CoA-transferase subunit A [Chloroflexota bacterium]MBM3173764.1 3-oxoacid CoA-transferase subunit A [Chloroflexota bacterium]MBM3175087.1 3-oxoacid CoA-transferase subunit A [Chloroflexota bacterium]MBM4449721.1 3-oxoacid CoA-transferase subunit A [Chloroflexota bacterium]
MDKGNSPLVNKLVSSISEAVADIPDGAAIGIGGFGAAGTPYRLVLALAERKLKRLTVVATSPRQFEALLQSRSVSRVITPFARYADPSAPNPLLEPYLKGEVKVEILPIGTLVEKLRAAGAGIPAFYCPVGVGTLVEKDKEKRRLGGTNCVLEHALPLDFALVKAQKGDSMGNLTYRMTSRCHNPVMAMAAKITVAEVDETIEAGQLDPETIVTPGIFVHRVVKGEKPPANWIYRGVKLKEQKT